MEKAKRPTVLGDRETMRGRLLLLREYARRVVAQGDDTLDPLEDLKDHLMGEYWAQGKSLKLTERDLVVLLYRGLLE